MFTLLDTPSPHLPSSTQLQKQLPSLTSCYSMADATQMRVQFKVMTAFRQLEYAISQQQAHDYSRRPAWRGSQPFLHILAHNSEKLKWQQFKYDHQHYLTTSRGAELLVQIDTKLELIASTVRDLYRLITPTDLTELLLTHDGDIDNLFWASHGIQQEPLVTLMEL